MKIDGINTSASLPKIASESTGEAPGSGFSKALQEGLEKVNKEIKRAEDLSLELSAGRPVDLPTVMMAINKADISFKMFVQVRNKALSAYEEIMRLQF